MVSFPFGRQLRDSTFSHQRLYGGWGQLHQTPVFAQQRDLRLSDVGHLPTAAIPDQCRTGSETLQGRLPPFLQGRGREGCCVLVGENSNRRGLDERCCVQVNVQSARSDQKIDVIRGGEVRSLP